VSSTERKKKGNRKRNHTTEAQNVEIKKGFCFVLDLKVCSKEEEEKKEQNSPPPLYKTSSSPTLIIKQP